VDYMPKNNMKWYPDTIAERGMGNPARFKRFCELNDVVSWGYGFFYHKVRGKNGYIDDPPFHDHGRMYFTRNGKKICVIHEYINRHEGETFEMIRDSSLAWAEKWGYACAVYLPERGWYCPPNKYGPGAACIVYYKPDVEFIMPE